MNKRIASAFSLMLAVLLVVLNPCFLGQVDAASTNSSTTTTNRTGDRIEGNDTKALVVPDTGAPAALGKPGEMVTIELPLAVNREYLPTTKYVLRNITIEPEIPTTRGDMLQWPFEITNVSYIKKLQDMTYGSMAEIFYEFKISETVNKGLYPVSFKRNATVWRLDDINGTSITEDVEFNIITYVNILEDGSSSEKINDLGALAIAAVDEEGAVIPAPSGNAGQRVKLRLPIVNNGGNLSNISITPIISTHLDEWPFVVEAVNYGKTLPDMRHGEIAFLEYDFKISPNISEGAKPINFRATYKENGVYMDSLFSAYINVAKGKPEVKELPDSVPKLMITGYKTNPEIIYAEDEFELILDIENTSSSSTIKNVGIFLTLEPDNIMPAIGESDTEFISSLKPKGKTSRTFKLTALSTAVDPTSTIAVTMDYENEKVVKGTATQAIVIPLKQRMVVSIDEPMIYDEESGVGDPIAVSMGIINKGKSKVYNLEIDIESDDISILEKYYGGDLIPAGKHNADFQIVGKEAGELTGSFVITYEDRDGEVFIEKRPFSINLDEAVATAQIVQEELEQPKNSSPLPILGGIGAAGAAAGGVFYGYKRRKRS